MVTDTIRAPKDEFFSYIRVYLVTNLNTSIITTPFEVRLLTGFLNPEYLTGYCQGYGGSLLRGNSWLISSRYSIMNFFLLMHYYASRDRCPLRGEIIAEFTSGCSEIVKVFIVTTTCNFKKKKNRSYYRNYRRCARTGA